MTAITVTISKQDFDAAVPAAREPKGVVFARLQNDINLCLQNMGEVYLGEVGIAEINSNGTGTLAWLVKTFVCQQVFLDRMRSLDLVLTGTGFGVVSTNDTAPASKMRVDALEGELRVAKLMTRDRMLEELFKVSGWGDQAVRQCCVQTLFWSFKFLKQFSGMHSPLERDWDSAQQVIMGCDANLREHLSDEFIDELLDEECSYSLSANNVPVVYMIRQYVGAAIKLDQNLAYSYWRRLMNFIEKNVDNYTTYKDSEAYELNHLEPYENKKDDSAFHFVG